MSSLDEKQSDALQRIKSKAIALAEAASGTGRPYLLSELGFALGEDLNNLKMLTNGGKLVDFVRNEMADRFELVLVGKHNSVSALIPRAGSKEQTRANVILDTEVVVTQRRSGPRYNYRFWAAFSVPLQKKNRYLNLLDLTFADTDAQASSPNTLLIPTNLIPPDKLNNRDDAIMSNIAKWLDANKLPPDQFLAKEKRQTAPIRVGASALEIVIDALDRRQLQSTSLTLDVISALMGKRIL